MLVGHTLGSGGPEIEFLVLAAACLVLGIFFFFQKNVKPQASVVLLVVAIALGVGAFSLDPSPGEGGSSPVTISISAPEDGAAVPAGEPLTLDVEIEGGSLTQDTSETDPTKGHLHVYVDEELASMPTVATPKVRGGLLTEGDHEITVEFTRADHRSFEPPVTTKISVTAG